ncbi:MAG: zinc-ribbon domain-containing protein [Myxococcota bacterium]
MIVKCEQCQTRFKIPDDKVTDKGVKVRCTKCGNTFRVGKDGAPIGAAVGAPGSPATQTFPAVPPVASSPSKPAMAGKSIQISGEPDPFSAFGLPPAVPDPEATRPGVFVLGLEASRVPDIGAPPIPPQAPTTTPSAGSAFDFSSLAPPVPPVQPPAATPGPRPVPRTSAPTARVPATAAPPPAQPAPFDFSALVPSGPAPSAEPAPFDFSAIGTQKGSPAAASTSAFDFSSLGPAAANTPATVTQRQPVGPPPPADSTPAFDFSGLGTPPPPAGQAPAYPPSSPGLRIPTGSQPGVRSPMAAPTQPGAPAATTATRPAIPGGSQPRAANPLPATQPAVPAFVPGQSSETQPAAAMPSWTTGNNPAVKPQSSAPMSFDVDVSEPSAAKTEALPALFGGSPSAADDFFGGQMAKEEPRAALPDDITGEAAKNALFDMAAALPAAPPEEPTVTEPSAERTPAAAPQQVVARPPPPAEAPRRRRTVLGIFVNVVIAAVLVMALVVVGSAYLNEGKVTADTLSWEHLKSALAPSTDFVTGDISNGLYDTKAGKPLFFVRGEVTNRGAAAVRLMVRAELLEGDTLVRDAESAAGVPASPEELYLVATAEDLEALNARVAQRSPVVEPGATVPFLVTFFEYPPDLKGFRVRVSARPNSSPSTATRQP